MNGTLLSLNQLLHNDWLFEIPIYQRGYAWEEENLRDLWDDLYYLEDREHYFGTVLLKSADKPPVKAGLKTFEQFEVIDGQQRLTTTLILLRELISQMKAVGDEDIRAQVSKLEEDYIVYLDNYKLTIARRRVVLPRHDPGRGVRRDPPDRGSGPTTERAGVLSRPVRSATGARAG